jgi:hypothetical protein
MSKRFIDTNLFSDEWFNELSKDCKLFFIYHITTCDHAGILKLNKKLCEFQTGIKSIETVIKELGNSYITLKEGVYWMPKFLKFQYPNFPKSNVRQQQGAINILLTYGINTENINTYLTVNKELPNSYVHDSDNESVSVTGKNMDKFIPPTLQETINFFVVKGFTQELATRAWESYNVAEWVDSQGKKIKNWKQKMLQVWMREDNRTSTKKTSEREAPKEYQNNTGVTK